MGIMNILKLQCYHDTTISVWTSILYRMGDGLIISLRASVLQLYMPNSTKRTAAAAAATDEKRPVIYIIAYIYILCTIYIYYIIMYIYIYM